MKRAVLLLTLAVVQLGLVGAGVWPQLSARATGETVVLRVAPRDPIDPLRGAYADLGYPDLQIGPDDGSQVAIGRLEDGRSGRVYVSLRREGEVWVAREFTRERPASGTYLACDDRSWQIRCGIESWFASESGARALEEQLTSGAYAELKVDGRGNAAVVDVRATP